MASVLNDIVIIGYAVDINYFCECYNNLLNCCYNEFKYILDHPTVPTVFYVVCQTTSAVVLWRSEFSSGSKQEFYVQYWRISQSSPSMLSPTIHDPGVTADLQYTSRTWYPTQFIYFI
jgi:hypothetical protein